MQVGWLPHASAGHGHVAQPISCNEAPSHHHSSSSSFVCSLNPIRQTFVIIIIIFYFENVTFFHAKQRVGRLPQGRQPNLWRHFTRFNSITSGKISISQVSSPWVLEHVFGGGMPFHTNQFGLGKETLASGNLFSGVEFLPPYHLTILENNTI